MITEAEPIFFVAEQIFCSFFTVELVPLRNQRDLPCQGLVNVLFLGDFEDVFLRFSKIFKDFQVSVRYMKDRLVI